MSDDKVLAQLAALALSAVPDDDQNAEILAEAHRVMINLVGDRQRPLFDRFVERMDEFESWKMEIRRRRHRLPLGVTYDVLAAARRRMIEASNDPV
jgi:hypothetical protein